MKKKSITFISVTCLTLVLAVLNACNTLPEDRDKILSGRSECWSVDICMVDQGTTRIVMGPRKEFEFPDSIIIKIQDPDGRIHSETLVIEIPSNSYSTHFPTIESAYKNADALILDVYFNDTSERIELLLDKETK